MSDDEQTYGDEGPAYGDEGPAYGDSGPAYGDNGPAHSDSDPAYSDSAPTYGDAEASYGDDSASYGDEGSTGYPAASEEQGEAAYGEAAYGDEANYTTDAQEPGNDSPDGRDTKVTSAANKARLKRFAAIGAGLLVLGGVGAGGYFLLLAPGDGDSLAGVRSLPVIGEMLAGPAPVSPGKGKPGSPAAAEIPGSSPSIEVAPSFWSEWISKIRGSAHDQDSVVAQMEDSLVQTSRAIDTYYAGHKLLPSTRLAIVEELQRMGLKPENPFHRGEPVKIEIGTLPKEAGAIAYYQHVGHYELRIGDGHGQVLKLNNVALVIDGPNEAEALPGESNLAAGDPIAATGATGAAEPTPGAVGDKSATAALGNRALALALAKANAEKLAGRPNPSASGMLTRPLLGTPAPLPSVPSAIADPGMAANANMSPHDALMMRLKRNKEFDYWRVRGISLVYSARTEEALDAFKKALEIHPNDESVTKWVVEINGVLDKFRNEALLKHNHDVEAHQTTSQPAAPPPVTRQMAPPRPIRPVAAPVVQDQRDDANKMFDELRKADKVPLLAPPKLDP